MQGEWLVLRAVISNESLSCVALQANMEARTKTGQVENKKVLMVIRTTLLKHHKLLVVLVQQVQTKI